LIVRVKQPAGLGGGKMRGNMPRRVRKGKHALGWLVASG